MWSQPLRVRKGGGPACGSLPVSADQEVDGAVDLELHNVLGLRRASPGPGVMDFWINGTVNPMVDS